MTTPGVSGMSAPKPKEIAKTKIASRSSKEKDLSKPKSSVKLKTTEKKPFKIVIRKLPVRDFNIDDFRSSLSKVLAKLGHAAIREGMSPDTERDEVHIEHFIEGKLRCDIT